jgi:hypothetical protein
LQCVHTNNYESEKFNFLGQALLFLFNSKNAVNNGSLIFLNLYFHIVFKPYYTPLPVWVN